MLTILYLHKFASKMLFLGWKNTRAFGGFAHGSPLDPTGALHRAPGPHATRLARVALFDFLFLINGAPNHPLPTGTLKQSHEREVRISSAEGARVRRRRKTSEGSLSPEAQEVLRSKVCQRPFTGGARGFAKQSLPEAFRRRRKRFCKAKPSLWTFTSSSVQTWSVNSKKSLPKNELNTTSFYWSQRKPIDNNGWSILSLG